LEKPVFVFLQAYGKIVVSGQVGINTFNHHAASCFPRPEQNYEKGLFSENDGAFF